MGFVRTVGGAFGEDHNQVTALPLPNSRSYRQVVGSAKGTEPSNRVPVLFSTNRGLYLRQAQPQVEAEPMTDYTLDPTESRAKGYDISFCDLERWSTNRANVISLEDTFNIVERYPTPQAGGCSGTISGQPRGYVTTGYRSSNYSHF
ncbi:uncharacterized protein LOC115623860 [Scaptodrosophila lebanonensis]|uniref:Uncharacterized protein LOC115623860 n=1 Tax=Drosophila lebanonensis TaxID=7225 RepID=A0A6J2TFQ6_DROLE|nr:uncharacterized protein LOC115623860 [Scaptodrosophila lebanonensis]